MGSTGGLPYLVACMGPLVWSAIRMGESAALAPTPPPVREPPSRPAARLYSRLAGVPAFFFSPFSPPPLVAGEGYCCGLVCFVRSAFRLSR